MKKHVMNANDSNKDAPAFLTKHEYACLYEAIHTSQLGLFKEVLLKSLKVVADVFRQVPVENKNDFSFFDQKLEELCRAFKKLKGLSGLYDNEAEAFRNIAVTAFIFYRILYQDAISVFSKCAQLKSCDVDFLVLFKRVPYKLYDFLGGQYWRLYEFREVIEGQLSNIKLNQDIKTFLEQVCSEIVPMKSAVSINPVNVDLPIESNNASLGSESLKKDFLGWVQKQLDQNYLILNEKGIYSSRFKYGADLFVDEAVLQEYAGLYQKCLQDLTELLKPKGSKTYKLNFKGSILEIYRLTGLKFIADEFRPSEIKEELSHGSC